MRPALFVLLLALAACDRLQQKEPLGVYPDPFADVKRTMNETASNEPMAASATSKPQTKP